MRISLALLFLLFSESISNDSFGLPRADEDAEDIEILEVEESAESIEIFELEEPADIEIFSTEEAANIEIFSTEEAADIEIFSTEKAAAIKMISSEEAADIEMVSTEEPASMVNFKVEGIVKIETSEANTSSSGTHHPDIFLYFESLVELDCLRHFQLDVMFHLVEFQLLYPTTACSMYF